MRTGIQTCSTPNPGDPLCIILVSVLGGASSLGLFMRTFKTPQLSQCGLSPKAKTINEFLVLTALMRKR